MIIIETSPQKKKIWMKMQRVSIRGTNTSDPLPDPIQSLQLRLLYNHKQQVGPAFQQILRRETILWAILDTNRILRNQKGKNKIKGGNPQGKQNKTKASTINSTNYAHGSVPVFDFNCL